jgi:hypothetical protein
MIGIWRLAGITVTIFRRGTRVDAICRIAVNVTRHRVWRERLAFIGW